MLIGLIISDKVCKSLINMIDIHTLQAPYSVRIVNWVKAYYQQEEKAPGKYIEDIFDREKKTLDESESSIISILLKSLSEEYEIGDKFNSNYTIDNSLTYLTEQSLRVHRDNIDKCLETGKLKKAESFIANYKKISQVTSKWVNPFDPKQINATFEDESYKLFKLPGALGDMIDWFERGYFVSIVAPNKRGKTWVLFELAAQGLINGYKVVVANLEMNIRRINKRFYKSLVSGIENRPKVIYPCFDCYNNQIGDCDIPMRENSVALIEDGDEQLPQYNEKMAYRPCTCCRFKDPGSYIPATWFTTEERPIFNLETTRRKMKATGKTYGNNKIRFIAYPRFSASMADFERDLDILEFTEGFVPDIIITDYIDIFRPDNDTGEHRHNIDHLWMHHARMATQRHALVITANQAKLQSWGKKNVLASDSSENYRNPAHVDIMMTLNQSALEKKMGIMRVAVVAHRDKEFHELQDVMILQQLSAGQTLIDSEKSYKGGVKRE